MTFEDILKLHPQPSGIDLGALLPCLELCVDCAASCTACADASLGEPDVVEMVRCIRLCLDCADTCEATTRVATRQSAADIDLVRAQVEACSAACLRSAEECERHAAHHEHCRLCADVCRRCKDACDTLLAAIA
jgi:uncharacterized protein DUF326